MKKVWLSVAIAFVLAAFAPDVMASCQDCRPDPDGGDMCWSGEGGAFGACWEEGEGDNKWCDGSDCEEGGGGDGDGDGGVDEDDLDPACNGWMGCSAECSSCWY